MNHEKIAKAYAQSLIDLGEKSQVDVVKEMTTLTEVINSSNNLENLLFLDVFTASERKDVLATVLEKIGASKLLKEFLFFLLEEKRIQILPLVFKDMIVIDDYRKGFLRGVVETGPDGLSEKDGQVLVNYLEKVLGNKIHFDVKKTTDVTAGFRAKVDNLMLDASIDHQFDKLKNLVLDK